MNIYCAPRLVTALARGRLRPIRSTVAPMLVAGSLILAGGTPTAWASDSGSGPAAHAAERAPAAGSQVAPLDAILTHFWPLVGHTEDVAGGADMTITGTEGVDYRWTEDFVCFPERALGLTGTGQGFASTTGAVLTTEESFSVATWVGLPSLTDHPQTILSQAGRVQPAMRLQVTPDGRWRFTVPTRNPYTGLGTAETEPGSVEAGMWHHLAGVLDLAANEVRLYVNGELAATGDAGTRRWPADGPFYLGVAGTARSITSEPLDGIVSRVGVWTGTLHPDRIRDMGVGGGLVPIDCF